MPSGPDTGHRPRPSPTLVEDAIRTRASLAVVLGLLALLLGACGTWDPTNQAGDTDPAVDEDPTVAGGTMELTVGDQTYSFSVDECYASPEDGIQLRGSTDDGERVTVDYDTDAPRDRTLQVIGENNEIVFDGNHTEGTEDPSVRIEEGGFRGSATFVRDDGTRVDGEMSGTC